jgi:hypothetical protein
MTDYTITTNFGAKDSLPSGNAGKVIKGSEFTTEFTNIQTAVNTKADTAGDTFTGVVNFSADVAVNTNTLFVDVSEAKVGIGTTSPDGKLDIEGDFEATKALVLTNTKGAGKVSYIRSHGANGEALSLYHDGQRRQVWDSTGYISFEGTGGEERMRIDSSGKVGIGTTSPANTLSIKGSVNQLDIETSTTGVTLESIDRADLSAQSDLSYYARNGEHKFFNGSYTQAMQIDASGKVGIGTDSPTEELHLNRVASGGDICARIQNNTGTSGSTATLRFSVTPNSAFDSAFIGSDRFNALILGSNVAERARIDSSGNLGIGTASPAARLDVHNGTALGGTNNDFLLLSRIHSFTGNQTYLEIGNLRDSTGSDWTSAGTRIQSKIDSTFMGYMQFNGTGNPHGISFGVGASTVSHASIPEAMRIDASGSVLVGTTDENAFNGGFSVKSGTVPYINVGHASSVGSGNYYAAFRHGNNTIGTITQVGTTGVHYGVSSDERLKENITDSADAGSKVDAIQIRQYDWKADGSHQDYGVIAQELVTVAPEAVQQPVDEEDMMGVDYSKLVPMLIKEVQSLRSRVAELENV